jgi:putative endonuclease
MNYYFYILANKRNWTLYVWVTNNLERRIFEHKNKIIKWFTSKYNIDNLVYFEETNNITSAIEREKQIKAWTRKNKLYLIESINKEWSDLTEKW